MKRKNITGKGLAVGLLFVFLFLFAGTTALHSGGCEQAFLRCIHDPYWQAVPFGIVYCSTGYAFCLKYIEG
jgi:hypothetical protein